MEAALQASSICRRSIQFGRLRLPKEPRQCLGLQETQRLGEEFPSGVRVRVHRRREGPWEEYSNGPEAQGIEQLEMPQDEHSKVHRRGTAREVHEDVPESEPDAVRDRTAGRL